jgi:radical SAM superfamily enzyme YgiQ (UPF0313 family)
MPMLASRGCPYQCTFCSSPQMWTTRYLLRNPDEVIAEIKHWIATYDITAVQFYDLTAIVKKSWTIEFCQKLLDSGIRLNWSPPQRHAQRGPGRGSPRDAQEDGVQLHRLRSPRAATWTPCGSSRRRSSSTGSTIR